jgi:putative DNA primase/helicase
MNVAHKIDFAPLMSQVATLLLGEPNMKISKFPHDVRFGTNGSLAIDLEQGIFYDHEAKIGGGVVDLVMRKTDRSYNEAVAWLRHRGLLSPQPASNAPATSPPTPRSVSSISRRIIETYPYRDRDGALLFEVVRYEPKDFRQRRPGLNDDWIWNLGDVPRVLYRLPEVQEAVRSGRTIYICEGEKDVHSICQLGFDATTCSGGAGKWNPIYNETLRDADVVLLPDNDNPGRAHA